MRRTAITLATTAALGMSALPAATATTAQAATAGPGQAGVPAAQYVTLDLGPRREVLEQRAGDIRDGIALRERTEHAERASRASTPPKIRTAPAASRAEKAKSKSVPSRKKPRRPAAPRTGHVAVDFALAQVGKPYRKNGMGPGGYDCSGLTSAAWARAGVQLPHYTGAQASRGVRVARSQAQPGDIVVLEGGGHVGLYIGGGQIVHAPYPGRAIEISGLWGTPAFRRVG